MRICLRESHIALEVLSYELLMSSVVVINLATDSPTTNSRSGAMERGKGKGNDRNGEIIKKNPVVGLIFRKRNLVQKGKHILNASKRQSAKS